MQAFNHGLVFKKVYRVIKLNQKAWLILSQTNILNIFTDSVPLLSVTKILQDSCICKTLRYACYFSLD